ncbi:PAS domain S-box protein [Campylobacterota bacterium DY0563]
MYFKRLLNWYILLSIVFVVFTVVFFKTYEKKEKDLVLKTTIVKLDKVYQKYLQNIKEYNEILFFNHFTSNEKLTNLLIKNDKSFEELSFIRKSLDNLSSFFKTYNIDELTIYNNDFKAIYNSRYEIEKIHLNDSHKKILDDLVKNKKEIFSMAVSNTSASLKIFKPIFDKNHFVQAILETSIDLSKLSHKMLINENISVKYIFKRFILEKNLDNNFLENYVPYTYDINYLYKKSFFNSRINNDLEKYKTDIDLSSELKFNLISTENNQTYLNNFIPISGYSSDEKIGYVIFNTKFTKYSEITYKYNLLTIFSIFFLLFVFIVFDQYKRRKRLFYNLQLKLNSITKSIDKYVILVETDLEGIITYCSQAFCDISGYKKSEIIGRPISIVRNPDISKKFFETMWGKISQGKTWEGEIKNLDKNGNSYWEKGVISPIHSISGKIVGYRAIKVNITDEKQLQKVNSLLKKELFFKLNEIKTIDQLKVDESKIKLMSQILDTFSSEWKKPISNISSNLLDFENRVDTARYTKKDLKEFVLNQKEEIKHLSINLNEFRKLFIDSDKNDKYNISEVIQSAIDSFSNEDIIFNFKGDETLENYGVFYDLKKVVSGIIINSIDAFNSKNIEDKKISIELNKEEDTAILKISDNAGGIPKEILPKIFDYNFSTKYHTKVEGLPLYLAKLIIEKSDGEMWVENIENGCRFFIQLKIEDKRKEKRELI